MQASAGTRLVSISLENLTGPFLMGICLKGSSSLVYASLEIKSSDMIRNQGEIILNILSWWHPIIVRQLDLINK